MNDFEEQNRRSWNAATLAHNSHKGDQALFLRQGGSTLFPEELALLGDVRGRSLLHLQCNAGQDSLSLAASRGRKTAPTNTATARTINHFSMAGKYAFRGTKSCQFSGVMS